MMSDQTADRFRKPSSEIMPAFVARALVGLLLACLSLVAWARLTDRPPLAQPPDSPIALERSVIIEADLSGDVSILDTSGALVAKLTQSNGGGFLATIDVVIDRKRMQSGITGNPPVTIIQRENGRVSILDPATGWDADLMAFGADNVGAFAKLLQTQAKGSQ